MQQEQAINDKVCRSCWTWYSPGHLVCPKCRIRLTVPEAASASTVPDATSSLPLTQPAAAPAEETPSGLSRSQAGGWAGTVTALGNKLTIGAIGVVLVAGAVLLLGARYFSPISATDGSFSVKAPAGWTGSGLKLATGEKPLLALDGPIQDGLQAHFVVVRYPGGYIPMTELEAEWRRMVETQGAGQNGEPGPFGTATVDGSPAVTSDSSLRQGRIEYLVVDHGSGTYIVIFTGAASRFAELRSSGFDAIIASWHWN